MKRPVNINLLKIKLPLTALLSITHRLSGMFVFFIVLPLTAISFYYLAQSLESYEQFTALIESNKEANIETPNEIFNLLAENLERTNAFDLALGGSEMVLKNSYGRNKEALQRIIRLLKKTGRESQTMPYLENFHKINPSNNTCLLYTSDAADE